MGVEELPIIGPFADFGSWLLIVVLVITSMLKGWLWPTKQVTALIEAYDKIISDKDQQIADWKAAYEAATKRGDILVESQREVLELGKNTNYMVQSILDSGRSK